MTIHVGLDMSLSSPGVALIDHNGIVHLLGFQQRTSDKPVENHRLTDKLIISRLPYPMNADRWTRSDHIVRVIMDWIDERRVDKTCDVHVYIENYAFGMVSTSVSKLCELGGIMRYALWKKGWTFSEISAGTIKKHFSGSGKASKRDMVTAYQKRGYPLMNTVLSITSYQHPQEDMVDALATLLTGLGADPHSPKKPKAPKRKPKVQKEHTKKRRQSTECPLECLN